MLSTNKTTCFKEVVDGQPFNEHSSHYGSYHKDRGNFDFSNRFDAEEVEWILNKPLDIIEGRTAVHVEVHRKLDCKSVDRLSQLLALGGSVHHFVAYIHVFLCYCRLSKHKGQRWSGKINVL